jgi:site-specific DNA recombinase
MGKVIGYARVSTDGQAEHGVSLEAQVAKIRAYCTANDLGEPEIVVDGGASAASLNREGMAAVLDAVKRREVSAFVVAKVDRASRSVRDLYDLVERFQRAGVAFHSIAERVDTTSATGRAFLGLLGVMAQLERELIGERTAAALRHLRTTGRVYGSTPFGFDRLGDLLVANAAEGEALALARQMRDDGATLRTIAAELTRRGVATKKGGAWAAETVRLVLRRAAA